MYNHKIKNHCLFNTMNVKERGILISKHGIKGDDGKIKVSL